MSVKTKSFPATLILATRNRHKVDELQALLQPLGISVKSALDYPDMPEVIEDGSTFEENAVKKAVEVSRFTGLPALADDSGLSVDALGGAPGVFSARFAGEDHNDRANNAKLLQLMADIPDGERQAHFVCILAYATPSGNIHTFRGICEGMILRETRGNHGFGYDPLFFLPKYGKTMAELEPEEKNRISHRAKAYQKFVEWLTGNVGD